MDPHFYPSQDGWPPNSQAIYLLRKAKSNHIPLHAIHSLHTWMSSSPQQQDRYQQIELEFHVKEYDIYSRTIFHGNGFAVLLTRKMRGVNPSSETVMLITSHSSLEWEILDLVLAASFGNLGLSSVIGLESYCRMFGCYFISLGTPHIDISGYVAYLFTSLSDISTLSPLLRLYTSIPRW